MRNEGDKDQLERYTFGLPRFGKSDLPRIPLNPTGTREVDT